MSDYSPLSRKAPLPDKVVRTNAWIDREHNEEKWPAVKGFVADIIAGGETSLPRVVSAIKHWSCGGQEADVRPACIDGAIIDMAVADARAVEEAVVNRHLRTLCARGSQAVLDLGSGWGWRLFDLWNNGMVPRDQPMYAMEYTPVGRESVEIIAALEPNMDIRVHHFDFYSPDYSCVPEGLSRITAFSVYALYHVPNLDKEMFVRLLDLADDVEGMFFEPIGFQFRDAVGQGRRQGSSLAHAEKNDFNRNLWSVLESLRDDGRLTIEAAIPDIAGANPNNALSCIHWRKKA
jgi:hypothetical protein